MKTLLGERLHFDWKIVTVIVVSTLLLIVDFYHQFTPNKDYDRTILYLFIPLLIIVLIFREDPRTYGFTFGDWKTGIILTAIGYCHHGDYSMVCRAQSGHAILLQVTGRRFAMEYLS